ncbi:MAG TPA: TonB-dependent receptor plug domain-containing protein, partial [Steroidobacteraceae bacterium]
MSILQVDRTRLSLAAAISMILTASQVNAQQAAGQEGGPQRSQLEEVVVTGSLIRGTPEDAALPVDVFSAAELEEQGDPSPLEFVKNLPIQGPTTGEAYYFSGSALTNNVQYNLRGIGADKTLTLFNGRRAFQNAVVYPSGAIERIEILKDGAAVTYGADATGGVVNIITRDRFEGVEVSGSYKSYKGSEDGE